MSRCVKILAHNKHHLENYCKIENQIFTSTAGPRKKKLSRFQCIVKKCNRKIENDTRRKTFQRRNWQQKKVR